MKSEKVFRRWLILSRLTLILAGAAVLGLVLFCLLCLDLQSSESGSANAGRYQVFGEGQNRLVAVLTDSKALAGQCKGSFLESAPYDILPSDGFRGRADYRQRGALVLEVRHEGDFYFAVLVPEGHLLNASGKSATVATVETRFLLPVVPDGVGQRSVIRFVRHEKSPSCGVLAVCGSRAGSNDFSSGKNQTAGRLIYLRHDAIVQEGNA